MYVCYCRFDVRGGIDFEPELSLEHRVGQEAQRLSGPRRIELRRLGITLGFQESVHDELGRRQISAKHEHSISDVPLEGTAVGTSLLLLLLLILSRMVRRRTPRPTPRAVSEDKNEIAVDRLLHDDHDTVARRSEMSICLLSGGLLAVHADLLTPYDSDSFGRRR